MAITIHHWTQEEYDRFLEEFPRRYNRSAEELLEAHLHGEKWADADEVWEWVMFYLHEKRKEEENGEKHEG